MCNVCGPFGERPTALQFRPRRKPPSKLPAIWGSMAYRFRVPWVGQIAARSGKTSTGRTGPIGTEQIRGAKRSLGGLHVAHTVALTMKRGIIGEDEEGPG